jgi:hypothetical protein
VTLAEKDMPVEQMTHRASFALHVQNPSRCRLAATRDCHARALIVVLKNGLTAQAGNDSTCTRLDRRDFIEKSR